MVERIVPWWRKALHYALSGIRSLLGGSRPNSGEVLVAAADEEEKSEIDLEEKETSAPEDVLTEAAKAAPAAAAHKVDVAEQAFAANAVDSRPAPEPVPEVCLTAEPTQEMTAEVTAILEAVVEVESETLAVPAVLAVTATDYDAISALEKIELAVERLKPEAIEVEVEMVSLAEPEETSSLEAEEFPSDKTTETVAGNATAASNEIPAETEISLAVEEQAAARTEIPMAASQALQESVPLKESASTEAETTTGQPAEEAEENPLNVPIATPVLSSNAAAEIRPADKPTPARVNSDAEQKTAARVAAAVKAREESADLSPFSIFVGQVYDGPLDLLLDLIRKQDIDIYDIPIARITAQFLAYVNQLKAGDMDVAGEFIYTASLLIHIKSKMLLPRTTLGPDDAAEDPRRELVERLLEHERFKNAAQMLQQKQMLEAATWTNPGLREFREDASAEPEIAADTTDLVRIFREILERARNRPIINVEEDSVTVGQMIQFLARRLTMEDKPVALRKLLSHTRSERALIAMFLALLELVRLQAILLRQDRHFSEIFIKKHTGFEAAMDQGLATARDDWR